MNYPRRRRRLGPLSDRPLPHLIRACGEKTTQVQCLPHGGDDLGKGRFGTEGFALFFCFGVAFKPSKAFFEGDGKGDDGVAGGVLFHPFRDFGKVFVFLADVVFFAEVDEEDDGFRGEEEEGVYYFDLSKAIISCFEMRCNRSG